MMMPPARVFFIFGKNRGWEISGVLAGVKFQGCMIVDHTTTSAKVAREMAQLCGSQEVLFYDAPVSGGPNWCTEWPTALWMLARQLEITVYEAKGLL